MKKFLVYLVVIVLVVSLGFTVFYFVRDNEIISISSASVYKDVGDKFALDVIHQNKKAGRSISVTSSDEEIVSGSYNSKTGQYTAEAKRGGVARINVRTDSAKFRNLWCDVIVGDGSVESPFYISTAEQLQAIGMGGPARDADGNIIPDVYEGAKGYEKYRSDLCYKLINNINVSQINKGYWVPLRNFSGRFDGNGMTLSNVYIDAKGYDTDLANDPNKDVFFSSGDDVGLFANILSSGIVYNLKIENFTAIGTYGNLGTIAGVNSGVIERIEVKNSYLSVKTATLGGLVGRNISGREIITIVDEEGNKQQVQNRDIARIDRCSITNLTIGEKVNVDGSRSVLGAHNTIGGLVGVNEAGTIVYSYVRGTVYFADDSTYAITYGGLVAENIAKDGFPVLGDYAFAKQGASIKDCYSDIRTFLDTTNNSINSASKFAGAIAVNQDYSNGKYNKTTYSLVNNYILGIYYNIDNLNYAQEGKTKNFEGIALFKMDASEVDFNDTKTIVYGYSPIDEMKVVENFVSHKTKTVEYNEDGISLGVIEKNVLWLFDTIWSMDADHNDNLPYLNYQLIYVPDDFESVGTPTISSTLDEFTYQANLDHSVTITSGTNKKLYMVVGERYQLQYTPAGLELTWTSTDSSVVSVDTNGVLTAHKKGSVSITATTSTGRSDKIEVVVENIVYTFMNTPKSIKLKVGESYSLDQIYVNPTPSSGSIQFTVKSTSVATYSNKTITGVAVGSTKLIMSFGGSSKEIDVVVEPKDKEPITITASPRVIEGCYSKISKTGSITLSSSQELSYVVENNISNSEVVTLSLMGNTINYTIKGTGKVTFIVYGRNNDYEGKIDIHFNIYDDIKVTASNYSVTGDISNITKQGTIQLYNNINKTFIYKHNNTNSNLDISISGSTLTYTIKGTLSTSVVVSINSTNFVGSVTISFNVYKTTTTTPSLVLNDHDISIKVGSTATLYAISGNYTNPITYSSNNSSVASVTSNGVVTGVSAGTAVITATAANGATAKCNVVVKAEEKPVEECPEISFVCASTYTIEKDHALDLNNYITGEWDELEWKSDDSNIASVDNNGVVTGVSQGQTDITITAKTGTKSKSIIATIQVIAKNIEIEIDPSSAIRKPKDEITITAKIHNATPGDKVVWTYNTYTKAQANKTHIDGTPVEIDTRDDDSYIATTKFKIAEGSGNLLQGKTIEVVAKIGTVSAVAIITIGDDGWVYDYKTLNAIRNNPTKTYTLIKDINVGSWIPIKNFSGTLKVEKTKDGKYYSLNNIQVTGYNEYAGLFANIKSSGKVENIHINNSNISATIGAGAIAGKLEGSAQIKGCIAKNTTISGGQYAGGIVGICDGTTNVISFSDVYNCNITVNSSTALVAVGGIVGKTKSNVDSCSVNNGSVQVNANAHGLVGGIAGESSRIISYSSINNVAIKAGNQDKDFAGGVVGKTTGSIDTVVVNNGTSITGFNAGGIGGEINVYNKTFTLSFKETKKGFRYEDLSSSLPTDYDVKRVAVKENVDIKGVNVGGLFSAIKNGIVASSYTRANLIGNSSESIIAGFAKSIKASRFTNKGGEGQVGIVYNCYSACKFSGTTAKSGKFAISQSSVHNHEGSNKRDAGYVFNYVFDKTLASGTLYFASSKISNIFTGATKDYYGAGKTTAEMKVQSTYTEKGINVFKFTGGYPTLSSEETLVHGYTA